jgi:4-O-beta-D-mannosyl-D-glucose phosphorylase
MKSMLQSRTFASLMDDYERLIARHNPVNERFYNGLYARYVHPVLTREHIPPFWMYDAIPPRTPS